MPSKKVPQVDDLKVGDRVLWKGHELVVIEITDEGYVTALSLQFRVTTDEPARHLQRMEWPQT